MKLALTKVFGRYPSTPVPTDGWPHQMGSWCMGVAPEPL